MSENTENTVYQIEDIMRFLPHRYPFLLLDRLEIIEESEKGIGLKNVTMNEEFFQGHFPGAPIMPGVLQVEAMAQTAGAIVIAGIKQENIKPQVFFMSIDKVKFRKPVKPGDQLFMHVVKIKDRGKICTFQGECRVDGKVVSQAEFTAMVNY